MAVLGSFRNRFPGIALKKFEFSELGLKISQEPFDTLIYY